MTAVDDPRGDWRATDREDFYRLDAGPTARPFYDAPADAAGPAPPGTFPFARGIDTEGLRRNPTLVKIYTGLGTPGDTGERVEKLVGWGAEIIQLAADLPTQVGLDPDDLMSAGEVGRAGVSIASLRDMEVIFAGTRLDRVARVGMLGNAIGPLALALFIALAERQGVSRSDFRVDLQNDPLKEYVARGTQILPIEPAVQLALDVVEWTSEQAPHWYPLDVCVNHLNAAGAGSTAGTAFALANAIHYISSLVDRGLDVDRFAPTLQLFLDEREDFFAAVCNVRATREIWARLLRDRFGARTDRALALEVTAYGHGRETRREPLNNIARIALGSLAYYLAGIQSLYTASYDEVLQTPSEEAVKVAIRTQQVIASELGFSLTADPLGGSYYVESLTAELRAGIEGELAEVERRGGAVAGIESGYLREVISEGAVRRQRRYEAGVRPMIGEDRFRDPDDRSAWAVRPTATMTEEAEAERVAEVAELRRTREQRPVAEALRRLGEVLRKDGNSVEPVLDAVRAYATVGEICTVFKEVFGEWQPDRTF